MQLPVYAFAFSFPQKKLAPDLFGWRYAIFNLC